MKIGYARVSTDDQNLFLQVDALEQASCEKIYRDQLGGGAKPERPGLQEALIYLRPGDTLVVWRLDRLGRSLKHPPCRSVMSWPLLARLLNNPLSRARCLG